MADEDVFTTHPKKALAFYNAIVNVIDEEFIKQT